MISLKTHSDDQPPPDGYGQVQTDPPEGSSSWGEFMQTMSEQAHTAAAAAPANRSGRLLICTSVHHGNTAKVAGVMAETLGADCLAPTDCPYDRLTGCPLLGIGSGVYYGRVHDDLGRWVRDLPEATSSSPPVFIFSTSGLPFLARFWHRPLRQALARKGFVVLGEFACRGFDTWGPLWLTGGLNRRHPDEQDLARARQFARRIGEAR